MSLSDDVREQCKVDLDGSYSFSSNLTWLHDEYDYDTSQVDDSKAIFIFNKPNIWFDEKNEMWKIGYQGGTDGESKCLLRAYSTFGKWPHEIKNWKCRSGSEWISTSINDVIIAHDGMFFALTYVKKIINTFHVIKIPI